jgi:hypothetical protein
MLYFHDPTVVERFPELPKDCVRHDDVARHRIGKLEHQRFAGSERCRDAILFESLDLLVAKTSALRDRRVGGNSDPAHAPQACSRWL